MIATIFDFNGVLVDDESVHAAAFQTVLHTIGIELTLEAYQERYLGFDDAGAFRAILTDAGRAPSESEIAALIEAKKPVYMQHISTGLTVFEGARALVERRARLGTVGIVSGALRHEIEHALAIMGVREHIAFIISAEDAPNCKPHPQGYLLGIDALRTNNPRLNPAHVVVIEDSVAGVESAKSAGLFCAAVTHSYPVAKLLAAGADVVTSALTELTDSLLDQRSSAAREGSASDHHPKHPSGS